MKCYFNNVITTSLIGIDTLILYRWFCVFCFRFLTFHREIDKNINTVYMSMKIRFLYWKYEIVQISKLVVICNKKQLNIAFYI